MRAIVMGVESSCDETAVGIVEVTTHNDADPTVTVLANRVASSMEQHARFGGVVPEVASRAHLEAMEPVMRAALADLKATRPDVDKPDYVAATVGPGLAGALLVGSSAAKAYAAAWGVPFYGMNHLAGHIVVGALADADLDLDHAIALLVSGGHTQILKVNGLGKPMQELGSTLDDAAGEAYDKVSRLLGLGYPGGPIIDKLAAEGNPKAIRFPRGVMRPQDLRGPHRYDFSFSGLKTSVARCIEAAERNHQTVSLPDVCASFQAAVADVLTKKALLACTDTEATTLLLGGGVAANSGLRCLATARCQSAGINLCVPEMKLCTDNGLMIAAAAAYSIARGVGPSGLGAATNPGLDVAIPVV